MKKITLFFAIIGMIMLNACQRNEIIQEPQQDDDTIAEVFELKGVNFVLNAGQYEIYRVLNPVIFASDNILIYRLAGTINPTTPIWQLIPRTLFLPEGQLDYDFDFSKQDFTIYANGDYNLALTPNYLNNQTFRIVIIPGFFSGRMATAEDFSDYHAVLKRYNISDKKVIQL